MVGGQARCLALIPNTAPTTYVRIALACRLRPTAHPDCSGLAAWVTPLRIKGLRHPLSVNPFVAYGWGAGGARGISRQLSVVSRQPRPVRGPAATSAAYLRARFGSALARAAGSEVDVGHGGPTVRVARPRLPASGRSVRGAGMQPQCGGSRPTLRLHATCFPDRHRRAAGVARVRGPRSCRSARRPMRATPSSGRSRSRLERRGMRTSS